MKPTTSDQSPGSPGACGDRPSHLVVVAVLAFVGAAWVLSGGCGLLGRPLASGLTWCALAVIGVALHPTRNADLRSWGVFGFGLIVAVLATASASDVVRLAGLAVCAAMLSMLDPGSINRRMLRMAAQAVAVLALYRFALTSIPVVWHASEMIGSTLGDVASVFWRRPLSVGATFAGLDHLVLMAVFVVAWAWELKRPRLQAVLLAVSAIVIGQTLYLLCLSLAVEMASALPVAPATVPPDPYVPPDWAWGNAVRTLLPWNLPAVAVLWHLVVLAAMLHLGTYRPDAPTAAKRRRAGKVNWQPWTPLAVAAVLPIVALLSLGKTDLSDKTILAYDQGYLDWDVPVHDRYGADSSGRFGMLPTFVESLGGQLQRSSQLTEEELSKADVLLLIHPNQTWSDELLARVHEYVRRGGSLLVAAGPRRQDSGAASSHNELLEPLGIPVQFDTAVSQNDAWRHGLHAPTHPATLGLGDDRDRFGMAASASIQIPWQASPILVGRWGWSDPGSDFFLTGMARWDAGERLGDLVLAAERRWGAGRIVVLGDTASLSNQGNVRAYRFTGRLLAYLAQQSGSPQSWWRQLLALLLLTALVVLWSPLVRDEVLAASVLTFLLVFSVTSTLTCWSWEVLPDGRGSTPNNLAYLDASHLEAYAESPWAPDAVDGLTLTLMRNGFLVLAADDLSSPRLLRAGMLVSVAPARRFTAAERKRVKSFVDDGGVFVAMAGATHGRKINDVLEPFGLRVLSNYHRLGAKNDDALPLGCLYRPYPDGENSASAVVFHAAWAVTPFSTETMSVVSTESGRPGNWKPIIARSDSSRGTAIVIGDTCFGMNKTLENQDGKSLTGDRVNAHFWRWLIGQLPGHGPWQPPPFDWHNTSSQSTANQTENQEPQP